MSASPGDVAQRGTEERLAGGGLAEALRLRAEGRYAAAEAALGAEASDAEALALLAHVQLLQGRVDAARATLARAEAVAPEASGTLRTRARLRQREGDFEAAVEAAEAAWRQDSADAETLVVLATARMAARRIEPAEAAAREALALEPASAEARVVLAQAAAHGGRYAEAAAECEAALALKPHLPVRGLLGAMRMALGERAAAVEAFRRAAELSPDRAGGWMTLGEALQSAGRFGEAREAYGRALAIDEGLAAAHINMARMLADEGRHAEALAHAERALAQRPDLAVAHVTRGAVRQDQGRFAEAEADYRAALAAQPHDPGASLALADLLAMKGEADAARPLYDEVLATRPSLDVFLRARLRLPAVVGSVAELDELRRGYLEVLEAAAVQPGRLTDLARFPMSSFYLAYHGRDDLALMRALDGLFAAKAPELRAPVEAPARRAPTPGKIRVGFVSQFLCDHTIGRLYEGLIAELDRDRFEVVVAHLPKTARDGFRERLDAEADRVLELPSDLARQRESLAGEGLDVLIYPDVGMSIASYLLAQARLAPVQAVGWGHPSTTGLESLDYFVSSSVIEPQRAETRYAERLVKLPRLPAFYRPVGAPAPLERAALSLPPTGRLYGCPQSLFKIHPDFDPVLAAIAAADPQAHIVFLEGPQPAWAQALRRRWAAWPGLSERAVFLPPQPRERFLSLMAAFDVLLDPPHFGSGNTLYEAMALGVPVVTWAGAFARGRIVAGAYAQMGLADAPVAARLEEYAGLAVGLASDPERLARLCADLVRGAQAELFNDRAALAAFEAFLDAATAAARRGERLAAGWSPEDS